MFEIYIKFDNYDNLFNCVKTVFEKEKKTDRTKKAQGEYTLLVAF
jgi:hypothetical protein